MPHSVRNNQDYTLAVIAECLYLLNLLILPGLAFIVLSLLYLKYRLHPSPVVRCHLQQAFTASLWAGMMIIIVSGVIFAIGDYQQPLTWVIVLLYFTSVHASLVLLGAIGLSKAINGQLYRFILIGPECPQNDKD